MINHCALNHQLIQFEGEECPLCDVIRMLHMIPDIARSDLISLLQITETFIKNQERKTDEQRRKASQPR